MKKKDLLSLPALEATPEILRLARTDRGRLRKPYEWNRSVRIKTFRVIYSRVAAEGTVLKIAFFCREDLLEGKRLPRYEVYISLSEERDMTYLPLEKKWSGSCISNLVVDDRWRTFTDYAMDEWEEQGARELANGILYGGAGGRATVYHAVDSWQKIRRANKLRGRHQREKERIDIEMNQVPDLPKDWDKWVYDSAYFHAHYMMYHPGDKENSAWCSACGFDVKLKKKARHGEQVRCPKCRKKVLALSWNRQKTIVDTKKPAILQERKYDGGYVLRVFESRIKRRRETDWRLNTEESYCTEKYRIFLDPEFRQETIYTYTFWKNKYTTELRWCNGSLISYTGGYYSAYADECILYYRNLKKIRKGTCLQYIPLETLFRRNEGCYGRAVYQFYKLRSLPQIEYLIKAGLYRLAWDMMNGEDENVIDTEKKNLLQALGIDRQQLGVAIKMDASARQIRTMKEAYALGIRMTCQQVEWYSSELGSSLIKDVLTYGHPTKMMKYMTGLKSQGFRAGDYIDYLDDVRILGQGRTEDVIFPKNFRAAHERLAEQRREKEEAVKKETIRRKDLMLFEMLPSLKELYTGTKAENDFIMVLPACKEDFNREGRENHNCVGGSYFDKMVAGETVVLFLRKKDDPASAFCTVEMKGATVVQCRAVRNSDPPDEVKEFMARYSREVAGRIRKKELEERILVPAI